MIPEPTAESKQATLVELYRREHPKDYEAAEVAMWRERAEVAERECKLIKERDELREEVEAGLQVSGSFFEALKPLNLAMIDVTNPGSHVTELIRERDKLKIKTANSLANNLCPDHRDKQQGKPCLACELEKLRKLLERAADDLAVGEGSEQMVAKAEKTMTDINAALAKGVG